MNAYENFLFFSLAFLSCSKKDLDLVNVKDHSEFLPLSKSIVDSIVSAHVICDSKGMTFDLTLKESRDLGIPDDRYFKVIENLQLTNNAIVKIRSEGNDVFVADKSNTNILTKAEFYALVTINNNIVNSVSFDAPQSINAIVVPSTDSWTMYINGVYWYGTKNGVISLTNTNAGMSSGLYSWYLNIQFPYLRPYFHESVYIYFF